MRCQLGCRELKTLLPLMTEMWHKTERSKLEFGFIGYQDPKTCVLKILERCRGTTCATPFKSLMYGQFSYHTHPGGIAFPSLSDIIWATEHKFECIGGRNRIRCFDFPRDSMDLRPTCRFGYKRGVD